MFRLVNIQQTHGDWLSRFQTAKFDLDSHIVQEICDLFSWLVAVYWVNCHFQAMNITTVMNNSWDSNCQNQLSICCCFLRGATAILGSETFNQQNIPWGTWNTDCWGVDLAMGEDLCREIEEELMSVRFWGNSGSCALPGLKQTGKKHRVCCKWSISSELV